MDFQVGNVTYRQVEEYSSDVACQICARNSQLAYSRTPPLHHCGQSEDNVNRYMIKQANENQSRPTEYSWAIPSSYRTTIRTKRIVSSNEMITVERNESNLSDYKYGWLTNSSDEGWGYFQSSIEFVYNPDEKDDEMEDLLQELSDAYQR